MARNMRGAARDLEERLTEVRSECQQLKERLELSETVRLRLQERYRDLVTSCCEGQMERQRLEREVEDLRKTVEAEEKCSQEESGKCVRLQEEKEEVEREKLRLEQDNAGLRRQLKRLEEERVRDRERNVKEREDWRDLLARVRRGQGLVSYVGPRLGAEVRPRLPETQQQPQPQPRDLNAADMVVDQAVDPIVIEPVNEDFFDLLQSGLVVFEEA